MAGKCTYCPMLRNQVYSEWCSYTQLHISIWWEWELAVRGTLGLS